MENVLITLTQYFVEEISAEDHSVKSPRFSPDGKTLVWLQRKAGGPHGACLRLLRADVPLSKNVSVSFRRSMNDFVQCLFTFSQMLKL